MQIPCMSYLALLSWYPAPGDLLPYLISLPHLHPLYHLAVVLKPPAPCFSWGVLIQIRTDRQIQTSAGDPSLEPMMCCEVSWKWSERHSIMSNSLWPHGLYSPRNSPGQNTGVGSLSLSQGIFPTQGSNPGLPHCRWILYQLSHKGSPRILEWVFFSSGSSQTRNQTKVSGIAGGFFTNWAIREALWKWKWKLLSCVWLFAAYIVPGILYVREFHPPRLKVVLSQRSVLGLKSPSLSGKAFPQLDLWKNTSILTSEWVNH